MQSINSIISLDFPSIQKQYLVSLKLFAQWCFLSLEVAQPLDQLYQRPLDSAVHQPYLGMKNWHM